MADPYVRQARGVFTGTVGSTDLAAGDAVYFDGTDWELADADDNTKYAEAIVINNVSAGEVGAFCRSCIIVDTDAPYTQGDQYYLYAPTGSPATKTTITATRPTVDANLRQVLGFALSSSELYVDIPPVREQSVDLSPMGATSAYTVMDSGNLGGPTLDANTETALFCGQEPENAVGIEVAYIWVAADATVGTPTMDVTVGSALNGVQHDAVTADATLVNQVREGAAAHEMERVAATTGFDATNIQRAGALLGVKCAQDDGGTDISWVFAVTVVFLVV